jgi:hypothetical protein
LGGLVLEIGLSLVIGLMHRPAQICAGGRETQGCHPGPAAPELVMKPLVATAQSALKRYPTCISNPDTDHLYRRAASARDDLASCLYEGFVNEACDHGVIESMGKDEQVLCDAVWNARE